MHVLNLGVEKVMEKLGYLGGNIQSEAEDDQHTQVCGLEIKNISSTSVFILWGSAGAGSCSNQELGTGGPEECSQAKYLKWRTSSTPGKNETSYQTKKLDTALQQYDSKTFIVLMLKYFEYILGFLWISATALSYYNIYSSVVAMISALIEAFKIRFQVKI